MAQPTKPRASSPTPIPCPSCKHGRYPRHIRTVASSCCRPHEWRSDDGERHSPPNLPGVEESQQRRKRRKAAAAGRDSRAKTSSRGGRYGKQDRRDGSASRRTRYARICGVGGSHCCRSHEEKGEGGGRELIFFPGSAGLCPLLFFFSSPRKSYRLLSLAGRCFEKKGRRRKGRSKK